MNSMAMPSRVCTAPVRLPILSRGPDEQRENDDRGHEHQENKPVVQALIDADDEPLAVGRVAADEGVLHAALEFGHPSPSPCRCVRLWRRSPNDSAQSRFRPLRRSAFRQETSRAPDYRRIRQQLRQACSVDPTE